MARKSEQSVLLFCMLFAFACLLLSGGWRLVGCESVDDPVPVRHYASIRAALSTAKEGVQDSLYEICRTSFVQRMHSMPAREHQALKHGVTSDANGNVLAAGTYMRAVYQAFVLDDGFV